MGRFFPFLILAFFPEPFFLSLFLTSLSSLTRRFASVHEDVPPELSLPSESTCPFLRYFPNVPQTNVYRIGVFSFPRPFSTPSFAMRPQPLPRFTCPFPLRPFPLPLCTVSVKATLSPAPLRRFDPPVSAFLPFTPLFPAVWLLTYSDPSPPFTQTPFPCVTFFQTNF